VLPLFEQHEPAVCRDRRVTRIRNLYQSGGCEIWDQAGINRSRVTIPLKDGMITDDDVFQVCLSLERIDLVGGDTRNYSRFTSGGVEG